MINNIISNPEILNTYKHKFTSDPFIELVMRKYSGEVILTGGAIMDIIDNRKVKDYDVKLTNYDAFIKALNLRLLYTSKTAWTFQCPDLSQPIQILITMPSDFDFSIASSELCISRNNISFLKIDKHSLDTRILVPNMSTLNNKNQALSALSRVPHYRKKGYNIADVTYLSLLRMLGTGLDDSKSSRES